jgi:hypothetical protein
MVEKGGIKLSLNAYNRLFLIKISLVKERRIVLSL